MQGRQELLEARDDSGHEDLEDCILPEESG